RQQNWLTLDESEHLLELCDFEVVKRGRRFLMPKDVPLLTRWVNSVVAKLPLVRRLCLIGYVVARPRPQTGGATPDDGLTCSVIVPCRNEAGNIEPTVARIPELGAHTEIVFVDGASTDGTREAIETQIDLHRGKKDIKLVLQPTATGKGDAVRRGFDAATGDVLLILDADLTVAPEDLPKFFE